MAMTSSYASSPSESAGPSLLTPALFTRTSIGPKAYSTSLHAAAIPAPSVRSAATACTWVRDCRFQRMTETRRQHIERPRRPDRRVIHRHERPMSRTRPPSAVISRQSSARRSERRAVTPTAAPAPASTFANRHPSPLLAPETSATLLERPKSADSSPARARMRVRRRLYVDGPRWRGGIGSKGSGGNRRRTMHCRCMRTTLILAAIASWARPAASFASLPGSAVSTDEFAGALVEASLTGCGASERNEHESGVKEAAADLAADTDKDGDGFISRDEYREQKESTDPETIAVATAVEEELPTEECMVTLILEKMAEITPGTSNGRMLQASREHRRLASDEEYDVCEDVVLFLDGLYGFWGWWFIST